MPACTESTKNSAASHHRVPCLSCEQVTRLLAGLAWRRDNTELLQHAEIVEVGPRLDALAASDAVNSDPRDGHRLARGRHAKQTSGVSSTRRPARHHLVPFGNHIINRDA